MYMTAHDLKITCVFVYVLLHSCIAYVHITKVRNKTNYEAPSFHTSGTPRNVPYTILTRNLYIYNIIYIYTLSILMDPRTFVGRKTGDDSYGTPGGMSTDGASPSRCNKQRAF